MCPKAEAVPLYQGPAEGGVTNHDKQSGRHLIGDMLLDISKRKDVLMLAEVHLLAQRSKRSFILRPEPTGTRDTLSREANNQFPQPKLQPLHDPLTSINLSH